MMCRRTDECFLRTEMMKSWRSLRTSMDETNKWRQWLVRVVLRSVNWQSFLFIQAPSWTWRLVRIFQFGQVDTVVLYQADQAKNTKKIRTLFSTSWLLIRVSLLLKSIWWLVQIRVGHGDIISLNLLLTKALAICDVWFVNIYF